MKTKNIVRSILMLCLVFIATSCSNEKKEVATKTIKDQAGDEVVVPTKIDRVVIAGPLPIASIYSLYMGSGDKIVGVHPAIQSAGKYSLLTKIAHEIATAQTNFIKGSDLNVEEMLALKPDVVLYNAGDAKMKEKLKKVDVASVGFNVGVAKFNTIETVYSWVNLLGDIFGEEDKSKGITEYGREIEDLVAKRIAKIDKKDYPKALMLYKYNENGIEVGGKNFFSEYWCTSAGLNCVSNDIEKSKLVNMEQIIKWNPDMMFVTNFSPYIAEDFYNNKTGSDDWSSINAIKNKNVNKFPLGMYRWFPPSSDSPLTLLWLAKTAHPEQFKDIDLNAKIKEYYKKFYKVDLSDKEVKKIFNPPREAANGMW